MVVRLRQGEVWVADLRPGDSQLAGKLRPVLVVQADRLNDELNTALVVPLSTSAVEGLEVLRPLVKAGGRLLKPSCAMVDQVRSVPLRKFGEGPLHRLPAIEWARVKTALVAVFGLV